MKYIVYCDESCHLQHDDSNVMILGSISCPADKKKQIYEEIRKIKEKHSINSKFEIKWTKVSLSKIDFYLELLDYFWKNENLTYRVLVADEKDKLNHEKYNSGSYDLWYYKMYFLMLDTVINPENEYQILIDIKDTKGGKRIEKLKDVLCNNIYDFKNEVLKQIAQINSKESEILQLVDLLNGAIAFHHRHLDKQIDSNQGKKLFVQSLTEKHNIDISTNRKEQKFNLFIWKPRT